MRPDAEVGAHIVDGIVWRPQVHAGPEGSEERAVMTAVDARLSEFRVVLEEQRRFRLAQLRELAVRDGGDGRAVGGAVADDVARALVSGAQFALGEIDAALQRMDTGCYGLCRLCGGPIGLERLEVLPMASLCIACQRAGRAQRR